MSVQGELLEINVIGCKGLRDTEWISRQDPYVVLEYASTKFRTKTDTDGGRNPSFNEKFMLSLIEGLREVNVHVWNSNSISFDDFIGTGKIQLQKVLSSGYDDSSWPLTTKSGKRAGEIRVIMHFANSKSQQHVVSSTPTYIVPPYQGMPPAAPSYYAPPSPYPASSGYPPMSPSPYPPAGFPPPAGPSAYGPSPSGYPPPQPPPYPQAPYGTYPPPAYPPQPGYGAPPPGAYPPYPGYGGYRY